MSTSKRITTLQVASWQRMLMSWAWSNTYMSQHLLRRLAYVSHINVLGSQPMSQRPWPLGSVFSHDDLICTHKLPTQCEHRPVWYTVSQSGVAVSAARGWQWLINLHTGRSVCDARPGAFTVRHRELGQAVRSRRRGVLLEAFKALSGSLQDLLLQSMCLSPAVSPLQMTKCLSVRVYKTWQRLWFVTCW